ncbi:MAG TPA: hypothetical protein VH497_12225 [Vicinamibacterales bacterium]|jgi:hypothetical protein
MPSGKPTKKRGRPPKFGSPGQVVAITLPQEVVRGLRRVHADLAWAIVRLFRKRSERMPRRTSSADSELVNVAKGRSLIVVNREVFKELPGINMIPLHGDRAFLALDRDAGIADLELAVVERMASRGIGGRERTALADLRGHLRRWRRNPGLRCHVRSIIVVERTRARGGATSA